MIGDMIAKIRDEKGMSKTELAKLTGINIGHITHIEKGERNPSRKSLKKICYALDVPYQQLLYTFGKTVGEEQETYSYIDYVPYNKIIAVDNINNLIDCPSNASSSSIAIKITDYSMNKTLPLNSYIFIEFNTPLMHNDIGLFYVDNAFYVRRFNVNSKGQITLKADNKDFPNIKINQNNKFYIVGKVLM